MLISVTALGADVRGALAVLFACVALTLGVVPWAIWIVRSEIEDSTRKPVFQGPYAEGRKAMTLLEAANVPCELAPLDQHGQVEVTVRSRDLRKARSALASKV
jgi:hypothetical protein